MKNTNGIPQANQQNIALIGQSKLLKDEINIYQQTITDYNHWIKLLELQKEELDSENEDSSIVQIIIEDHHRQIQRYKLLLQTCTRCQNHLQEELFINAHTDGVNVQNILYANDVSIEPIPYRTGKSLIAKIIKSLKK